MANPQVAHLTIASRAVVAALTLCIAVGALAAPSLKVLQTSSAHLQLGAAPYDLAHSASRKSSIDAHAVSMASADFNLDGFADLISGYAQGEGGFIALH